MIDAFMLYPQLAYIVFGFFSLLVGSFLNVVIYRLPFMLEKQWKTECRLLLNIPPVEEKPINLWLPRSHCPHCKHIIPAWHNIPILSFCLLKARCAYCNARISWQYPIIEFITLVLSLLAVFHFGIHWPLLFALIFIWCTICLTKIDLDHQLLPDGIVLSLLWLGLIANTQNLFTTLPNAVLSAVGAYIGLWGFVKLFQLITGKVGMGHGDLKLFSALSAWFGWIYLPQILLISSITGAIAAGLYLKITKKSKNTPIPFGPFLCFAGIIVLFNQKILNSFVI